MNKSFFFLAFLFFVISIMIAGCTPKIDDGFAKCLTDKGVKMYGAYWCSHCQEQKEMFGSSWQYVTYVECSLPDNVGQTEICLQKEIEGYPTWELGSGARVSGKVSLDKLSTVSGCPLLGYTASP